MFVNSEVQRKYEERLQNYTDAVCMREPKRLSVGFNYHTAQMAWRRTYTKRVVYDPDFYAEELTKFYEDFDIDLLTIPSINPLELVWVLGRNTFFVGKDGHTVQHRENVPMHEDEYDDFIKDPIGFITGTLFPRKFPHLMEGHDISFELLRAAAEAFIRHRKANAKYGAIAKDKYGILPYNGGKAYIPFDVIMDRIRGIPGMMSDIRRQPQKVIDACNAIQSIYLKPLANLSAPVPMGFLTLHAPMFINRKQFDKFYWPHFKEIIEHNHKKGSITWIQLQGDSRHVIDRLLETPRGSAFIQPEIEDIIEIKKRVGHHVIIEGGVPLSWYVHKSKQECLDLAKRIIDECAPGGGFVFGAGVGSLSGADINHENMQAVYQLVHDYRK
jgi:hypothetical protein